MSLVSVSETNNYYKIKTTDLYILLMNRTWSEKLGFTNNTLSARLKNMTYTMLTKQS